jgi:hypothetical protein
MRWKMATLLAVILIGSVAEGALAQGRGGLEITPMIGYRWGEA